MAGLTAILAEWDVELGVKRTELASATDSDTIQKLKDEVAAMVAEMAKLTEAQDSATGPGTRARGAGLDPARSRTLHQSSAPKFRCSCDGQLLKRRCNGCFRSRDKSSKTELGAKLREGPVWVASGRSGLGVPLGGCKKF